MSLAKKVGSSAQSTSYDVGALDLGIRRNNVVLFEIAVQSYSLKKRGAKERAGVPRRLMSQLLST